MRFKYLNENVLLEREVAGVELSDIIMSQEVQTALDAGNYQQAYDKAKLDTDTVQLYVVFIYYYPTKAHLAAAARLNGKIAGYDDTIKYVKGYLQENKNKKVSAGGFQNITNLGAELLDIVDETNPNRVLREGYFKLLETPTDATPYTKENADGLVKKLKGFGSGIEQPRIEQANRKALGQVGSEKELVINKYLTDMFGANEQKIKEFRDLVIKVAVELKLTKDNPLIKFLQTYLKTYNMTRQDFIILNNAYANGTLTNKMLTPAIFAALLKSYEAGDVASPAVRITGNIPASISAQDNAKFDSLFSQVKPEDIPTMMAYLKNKKLIG